MPSGDAVWTAASRRTAVCGAAAAGAMATGRAGAVGVRGRPSAEATTPGRVAQVATTRTRAAAMVYVVEYPGARPRRCSPTEATVGAIRIASVRPIMAAGHAWLAAGVPR